MNKKKTNLMKRKIEYSKVALRTVVQEAPMLLETI